MAYGGSSSPSESEMGENYFHFVITNLPYNLTRELFEEILLREVDSINFVRIEMDYSDTTNRRSRARLYFNNEEALRTAQKKIVKIKIEGYQVFIVEKHEGPKSTDRRRGSNLKALFPHMHKLMLGASSSRFQAEGAGAVGGDEGARAVGGDEGAVAVGGVGSGRVAVGGDEDAGAVGGDEGEGAVGGVRVRGDRVEDRSGDVQHTASDDADGKVKRKKKATFTMGHPDNDNDEDNKRFFSGEITETKTKTKK